MNPKVTEFKTQFQPIGEIVQTETLIPWSFSFLQAGHESAWGTSRLTIAANNLFGFTANDAWMAAEKPTAKFLSRECSDKPPEQIRYWQFEGDIFEKHKTPAGGSELQVWLFFRKYESWQESLRDWANLIMKPRFAKAYEAAKAGNFNEFAQGLEDGGYATDKDPKTGKPVYAAKLIALRDSLEGIA